MVKVKAKQIEKVLAGLVYFDAEVTATENNVVVTDELTTALEVAGDNGTSVPLQVSTGNGIGLVTSGNNIAQVYTENGLKLADADGNEVYARLVEAAGVYTANLFVLVDGTETAFVAATTETLSFAVIYKFGFETFPSDAIVGLEARYVVNDPIIPQPEIPTSELSQVLVATALNTLPAVASPIDNARPHRLIINSLAVAKGTGAYTVSGTAITWVPATAGFNIDATDSIVFEYFPVAS